MRRGGVDSGGDGWGFVVEDTDRPKSVMCIIT